MPRSSLAKRGSGLFAEAYSPGRGPAPAPPLPPGFDLRASPLSGSPPPRLRSDSARKRNALRRWRVIEANVVKSREEGGAGPSSALEGVVRAAVEARRKEVRDSHLRRVPVKRERTTELNTFQLQLQALRAENAEEHYASSDSSESESEAARSVWMKPPCDAAATHAGDGSRRSGLPPVHGGGGDGSEGHMSLAEVMVDPAAYHYLRLFAEAAFAQESLLFLQSTDEVRSIPAQRSFNSLAKGPHAAATAHGGAAAAAAAAAAAPDVHGRRYLETRVKQVFRKFVAEGARLQVNLSDGARERIAARMGGMERPTTADAADAGAGGGGEECCLSTIFDEARHEVFELVEADAYARFCASPHYAAMIEALRERDAAKLEERRQKSSSSRKSKSVRLFGGLHAGAGGGGGTAGAAGAAGSGVMSRLQRKTPFSKLSTWYSAPVPGAADASMGDAAAPDREDPAHDAADLETIPRTTSLGSLTGGLKKAASMAARASRASVSLLQPPKGKSRPLTLSSADGAAEAEGEAVSDAQAVGDGSGDRRSSFDKVRASLRRGSDMLMHRGKTPEKPDRAMGILQACKISI